MRPPNNPPTRPPLKWVYEDVGIYFKLMSTLTIIGIIIIAVVIIQKF